MVKMLDLQWPATNVTTYLLTYLTTGEHLAMYGSSHTAVQLRFAVRLSVRPSACPSPVTQKRTS